MSVNGIGAAGGQTAWYHTQKTEKEAPQSAFAELVAGKENEKESVKEQENVKEKDIAESAFEQVGPNAPEKVKKAWLEAAEEVGANGMGVRKNGMLSHISQMMVQRIIGSLRGEVGEPDVLGSTVGSAIRATKKALYDLEHPLTPGNYSLEVQQARVKEGEFYRAFLSRLEQCEKNF